MRNTFVRQFSRPTGLLGRLAGVIMATRPSNLERNMRTLALADIQPDDRVLEIGFGPGIAIERAAGACQTRQGDRHRPLRTDAPPSEPPERNCHRGWCVELRLGTAERLPEFSECFDKVIAINAYMFWKGT